MGGDALVPQVAQVPNPTTGRKISADELDEMHKAVSSLPEARRQKIVAKITKGDLSTSAEVKKLAPAEQTKIATKEEIPLT
jgi:hypothetical protein